MEAPKFRIVINHSLRVPEEVSRAEWCAKGRMYGTLKFTEEECEFFGKFSERNKEIYSKLNNDATTPFFIMDNLGMGSTLIKMRIYRLNDDWYLIDNYVPSSDGITHPRNFKYYICDEWEEVLGFLGNHPNFRF